MKIVVLVKQVPDTWGDRKLNTQTGLVDRDAVDRVIDEIGERALELALSYRDSHKGTEVVVLSMGPASVTTALRKALSMGADSAIHVLDDSLIGADVGWTAQVLAAAIARADCDLVVGGNESTDGRGGVIPAMIAEHLGRPYLGCVTAVDVTDSQVSAERSTESGLLRAHCALPAVISVTESMPEARFPNFKGILTAKKKPLEVLTLGNLGLDPASSFAPARSVVVTTSARPARSAGTITVDTGNAGVELADFLAAERLI
ncbi:electron transfer flavoprotein subunit beta/FixA family protein [Cryobacterium sp. CG_9.6]|uniref:electron transfer flavoprotein subunit beta/FixA family protein n=1 Tax=Cryobacterium sp. CG_9.6 TaxID=2760710 RepID=UPI0024731518|nr:electron transfer flavoprotein subunit beta/FixA family protein [Cryobacterium sp. CG_9.6]MDH6237437.1 electron transfer flavoprotein beta subunit [Cryobacterium sp. CG_9.6]